MLTKRIIPCLDVKNGKVVKGVQFQNHEIVGDIVMLAEFYSNQGADELVFYDITASSEQRVVNDLWVKQIADKISVNSPALENLNLINQLVKKFGQQCVVIGIDSLEVEDNYYVCQYTGDINKTRTLNKLTADWIQEVQDRGAGEIVLNCMNHDGVRKGYDIKQLSTMREITRIPLIASGGAGDMQHFLDVFEKAAAEGEL